jgi:MFS family permease
MIKSVNRFFSGLPCSTWLLTLAQAINLTCAVISVTVSALAGAQLTDTPSLGTAPYGAQFAAMMLFTYPASILMRYFGRRVVFCIAALFLIASGGCGFFAIQVSSFSSLILTHALLGIYMACANYYRFAAVDHLDTKAKPKALSLVVAGGVLAAVVGPSLANVLRQSDGFADFSLCYASFCGFGVLTLVLIGFWKPKMNAEVPPEVEVTTPRKTARRSPIFLAIFCSAWGYFLMNLMMVQASLVMKGFCSFTTTSQAIQAHVLAMFVPSFLRVH